MLNIEELDQQSFSSVAELCNALRTVGICGTICEEFDTGLNLMTTKYGGEKFILQHGLGFWVWQILRNGGERVVDYQKSARGSRSDGRPMHGGETRSDGGPMDDGGSGGGGRSGDSGGSRDGEGSRGSGGSRDGEGSRGSGGSRDGEGSGGGGGSRDGEGSGGGGGSVDTQSSAAAGGMRPVNFMTSPTLPLETDALLGLPPKISPDAMVKEANCPEKAVFYHGCPWLEALPSISRRGILRGRYGGFYSPEPATYWSTFFFFRIPR
jgi:hypothetical protein